MSRESDNWIKAYREFLAKCDREEAARREVRARIEKLRAPLPYDMVVRKERTPNGKLLLRDEFVLRIAERRRLEREYVRMP
jgi:hypothetical protein